MARLQICLITDAPRIKQPRRQPSKRKSQNLYSNAPDVKKFSITHRLAPRRCITSKHEKFDSQCASKTSTWNSRRHKQHFDDCTITETLKRQSKVCSKIAIKSQM